MKNETICIKEKREEKLSKAINKLCLSRVNNLSEETHQSFDAQILDIFKITKSYGNKIDLELVFEMESYLDVITPSYFKGLFSVGQEFMMTIALINNTWHLIDVGPEYFESDICD